MNKKKYYMDKLATLFNEEANRIKNSPRKTKSDKRQKFLTLMEATRFYLFRFDISTKRKEKV